MGADRMQTIYKDWSVKLHADGQWANGALISNEQYAMGGTAGVRGYQDGQAYGDTGWRFSIEPQTPLMNIGMVGNEGHEEPCWVRASVFLDYGRIYLLDKATARQSISQRIILRRGLGRDRQYRQSPGRAIDGRLALDQPCRGIRRRSHLFRRWRPILNAMTNNMSPICNVRSGAIALNLKIRIVMRTLYRHPMFRRLVAAVLMLGVALDAMANPTGMTVQSGSATATVNGSQLTDHHFAEHLPELAEFQHRRRRNHDFSSNPRPPPSCGTASTTQNPSQIYGSLQANGIVVLLNSSGFYFGPNSFVSAAGLVVSTANCAPPQNSGGGWEFNGPPPLASIVNYGQIKIGNGGSAFLIADQIENHGSIEAPGGTVGLAAGQTVLLSDRPDGRGMSMQVTLPSGSVDNEGRLIADGGTIAMNARVVNQNGFIQANSVQNQNGIIELVASDQLKLGANSQIIASGDDSPAGSAGGNVTLQSGNNFSDSVGSQIITTGGAQGGNGGNVEISAPNVLSLNSSIDARRAGGLDGGEIVAGSGLHHFGHVRLRQRRQWHGVGREQSRQHAGFEREQRVRQPRGFPNHSSGRV